MAWTLAAVCLTTATAMAQTQTTTGTEHEQEDNTERKTWIKGMDLGVTAGTTGVGIEVSAKLSNVVRLRAGFSAMPRLTGRANFGIGFYDKDGTRKQTNFKSLASRLQSFTGYMMDDEVTMMVKPKYYNFNLMVDVFPLKNKHWFVTAGLFLGNKTIGEAYNATEEMPALVGLNIYNHLYEMALSMDDDEPIPYYKSYYMPLELAETFVRNGRMGIGIGTMKSTGETYRMETDADFMVRARVEANKLKPYLGVGYETGLDKARNNQHRYHVGVDCGVLFWGGMPKMITHDGTDLIHDVENIHGDVGKWVDLVKTFKVFPVLNVRFTHTIF